MTGRVIRCAPGRGRATLALCAVLAFTSCGGPDDTSQPGPLGSGGSVTGGETGTGGTTSGGSGIGGVVETGGGSTAGGTGGVSWNITGGAGGDGPPELSDDPEIASRIAAHDVACEAACTTALVCQPVMETMENCLEIFFCLRLALRVDASSIPRESIISCLDAGIAHMNCVAALECSEYYGWWNENVDPFPCEAEQTAEEEACAGSLLF